MTTQNSQQYIKLKLKAFDHRILDQAASEIVDAVQTTGAKLIGPVAMPVKHRRFTVNRSTHVHKKSRERFEIRTHQRLIIIDPKDETVNALMKLDLTSGVEIEIKLFNRGEVSL